MRSKMSEKEWTERDLYQRFANLEENPGSIRANGAGCSGGPRVLCSDAL
jgi:hypothetical protein